MGYSPGVPPSQQIHIQADVRGLEGKIDVTPSLLSAGFGNRTTEFKPAEV